MEWQLLFLSLSLNFQQIVVNQFSRVAANGRCSFIGNITLGKDVSLSELRNTYHVVSKLEANIQWPRGYLLCFFCYDFIKNLYW
jgi:hypothetical protein